MTAFASAYPILRSAAVAFRPPRRVSVAQGAADALVIRQPGGYSGPWSAEETPYMIEPMDMLASRRHEAVCFVGPARTGKTMGLLDAWMSHVVAHDPGDMLIVQMSQEKAREFSKTRVDRAIRNSPTLRALMSTRGHDDNTHDKLFRHGMWLKIGWPSATQLSGSDYRYVAVTDLDRMPDDVDGEGSVFGMALKRTTTFLSRGMCMVESSPGRDQVDPGWKPVTQHEGPPVTGILGIYNRGDRRRWYWQCPDCNDYFEASPGLQLFSTLPPQHELLDEVRAANLPALAEKHARVVCPCCGSMLEQKHKHILNDRRTARWVPDGQTVTPDGELVGEPARSSIASYWLGGVAAAYQRWDGLILRYLQGLREYALSGSTHTLKNTVNLDQGCPFLNPALAADREQGAEDRIDKTLQRYIVPAAARFLVATVDVQGGRTGRFVCEVRAFGVGLESWLVDRFDIATTDRNGSAAQIDPSAYAEDWDILTDKLVRGVTYRLADGRELRILRVGVDLQGESGTTTQAYAWFRRLRSQGLSSRVRLLRGDSSAKPEKPMVQSHARSNTGAPMHDLPIWNVCVDYYKDQVDSAMRRRVPGPGYFHAAQWIPARWWDEVRAEVRDANGKWKKVRARNEALDLWVQALALAEELGYGAKGRLSWDNPPSWARPLDGGNSEIVTADERRAEQATPPAQRKRRSHDDWSFDRRD